ncbi:MAG: hypothetical protein ACLP4R_16410 [Solirubrobacteraceae bacterium]
MLIGKFSDVAGHDAPLRPFGWRKPAGPQLAHPQDIPAVQAFATRRSVLVHLISLAERRPRASSVDNAEVALEHDQAAVDSCIARLSERLASGPTLTAQIRGMKILA